MRGKLRCHSENVIYAVQMKRNYHAMILTPNTEKNMSRSQQPHFWTNTK